MLGENIRRCRTARGMTQGELASALHVVRQTVSKWERSLSAPDAEQLVDLAGALGVTVDELLGIEERDSHGVAVEEQLAKAEEEIARHERSERARAEAGRVRGLMLALGMLAVMCAHVLNSDVAALVCVSAFSVAALAVLYRNAGLLSRELDEGGDADAVRAVTLFDIALLLAVAVGGLLVHLGVIDIPGNLMEKGQVIIVAVLMAFLGTMAPRLPWNRHTGLRLPWTILDEGAWRVAHRALGVMSVPLAFTYLLAGLVVDDIERLTLLAMAVWVGVPALLSLLHAMRVGGGAEG